ncbi:asparagine synthase (glutamine-hydrolyzing) [Ferroacidibacillus organovorans]|uniref:asparagine synthase (glutamine-hydrolyzing) n=1 Tax=Ferroacidibacillus organovorans TaxID=1765683 RepID=A0A1V4EU33_9BACL|nr:asparagine synthase (glutamine-hydrolyzing) [Ferroacidibacillus organovorans]OPG16446.1 asparagine synthase (glutamine-hydrolyzing) [Ferroacidibacillus organovorans]
MCGIAGLYHRVGAPIERETLARMNAAIIHRGPDDDGFYFDGPVGLAFRRLSIIDLEGGHQPLSNEDQTVWVVFNGEIYNFKTLREDLVERGHSFATDSDTEVIVHLYEEYGFDFVNHLRGMFAIGLYDQRRDQLLLVRDPFGIKPLYYTVLDDVVGFGSEIKSLLEIPGISRDVDRESFWHYLTFQYVPDPNTMISSIKKLRPAHMLIIRGRDITEKRYQHVTFEPVLRPIESYIEETLDVLRDSVKVHMNSDVPRGAFLSSGVDSSAIVALLKELEDVQTFTVGFEGAGGQSEIEYARETASLLGTTHRDTIISASEYLEMLPRLIYQQDEPVADPSAIALYFVSQLASQYVTVVLSGEGADELFGGYTIYREPLSLRMFDYLPMSMRRNLGQFAQFIPEGTKGRSYLIRGSKKVSERFFGNANLFTEDEKRAFAFEPRPKIRSTEITAPHYERASGLDDVTKMQYVDLHTWLPGDILMKADKMTMANSLELRVPFLDSEVFRVARQIPAAYRMMNGTTKYVLRQAVKSLLPEPVYTRKKLGFPVPTRTWLRNEHYAFARDVILQSDVPELFDKDEVLRMLEDHRAGRKDHARKIWSIVIFLLWHDVYITRRRPFVSEIPVSVHMRRTSENMKVTV